MRKARLGRAESEVLRYIGDKRAVTAREAADYFTETRGLAKTTVLSVIERLRGKGFLTRELSEEGVYLYAPATPKARMLRDLVGDFVNEMLGGSLEPVSAYLAQRTEVSDTELEELKAVVAALEERKTTAATPERTTETKAEEKE